MRSDESVMQGEVKRAQERSQTMRQGVNIAKNIGGAAIGAGTALAGGKLLSKIAPFLSEYIPIDLAFKGISKVNPKLGAFLENGMKQGLDLQEGLNYIKDKFQGKEEQKENQEPEEKQEPAKQKGNIIEQYSPELFSFLKEKIAGGMTPQKAAGEALGSKKAKEFNAAIDKMVGDHQTTFSEILESIFGTGQTAQPQKSQFNMLGGNRNSPAPSGQIINKLLGGQQQQSQQSPQQMQPQPQPQPQQQGGQGEQRLMSAIQQLRQLRGG